MERRSPVDRLLVSARALLFVAIGVFGCVLVGLVVNDLRSARGAVSCSLPGCLVLDGDPWVELRGARVDCRHAKSVRTGKGTGRMLVPTLAHDELFLELSGTNRAIDEGCATLTGSDPITGEIPAVTGRLRWPNAIDRQRYEVSGSARILAVSGRLTESLPALGIGAFLVVCGVWLTWRALGTSAGESRPPL